MLSKIIDYRLQVIDYIILLSISATVISAYVIQNHVLVEKLFHLIPGTLIVFFFLKFLLSTPLAEKNFDKAILGILWFSLFYYIIYIAFSSIYTKETDLTGHIRYIKFLANGELPSPSAAWQTYHPPLFHTLSTPFYLLGKKLGLAQPFDMVRYFCLISYMVFLYYSALLFSLILNKKIYEYIALSLLVLWPIGIIFSAKINNDILIYSTIIAGLYYLVNWYKNKNKKHLWYAVNIGLLALTVKTTSLIFCFVIFICIAIKITNKEITIRSIFNVKKSLIIFTIIFGLVATSANFGRTLYHNLSLGEDKNFIAGNITVTNAENWNAGFIEDDNIRYYTTINFEKYFNEPFILLFSYDHDERKYFWNSFIKSSIVGVGRFFNTEILKTLNSSYLLLLIYVIFSYTSIAFTNRNYILKSYTPLFLLPLLSLSGMIYMRNIFHLTGYSQSRFMHYFVPILIIFLLKAIDYHKKENHKLLYYSGLSITSLVGILFFIFMVSQFRLN